MHNFARPVYGLPRKGTTLQIVDRFSAYSFLVVMEMTLFEILEWWCQRDYGLHNNRFQWNDTKWHETGICTYNVIIVDDINVYQVQQPRLVLKTLFISSKYVLLFRKKCLRFFVSTEDFRFTALIYLPFASSLLTEAFQHFLGFPHYWYQLDTHCFWNISAWYMFVQVS